MSSLRGVGFDAKYCNSDAAVRRDCSLQRVRGTPRRLRQRTIDARLRKRTASATDHALHLCKSLLAGNAVIGAIRSTGARQGSDSRLYRQPHVDESFLGRCN
jgi:hypothetical protein